MFIQFQTQAVNADSLTLNTIWETVPFCPYPLLYFSLSVPPSVCLILAISLCQRPPDQSVCGCHGNQQSAAAWVYFVVS